MYEYAPRSKKRREIRLFLVSLTPALLFFVLSLLPQTPAPLLCRSLGLCEATVAAWIAARYLLRRYIYRVAPCDSGGASLDLTVTEIFGKRQRVVCRISLEDIEEISRDNGRKERGNERFFQYTDEISSPNFCILTVRDENTTRRIKMTADETLYHILKSYR